ncbi:restriction endonuclease [Niabella insulamsoli]|uniref:nSTAND3 domain-containing NTPase n=1 Tax=Niabella insulamsoli TaxID=3144874 RepID=UPI0031FD1212
MTEYDFLVLSPHEFENLSRDLLQKKLSVFIESFTTGRDNGIDLRFAEEKNENTIIQAKRYKDYTSLLNNLKKEVDKVKKLSPNKYMITTSVGLTPINKDAIKKLFHPFIQDSSDIFGKDDLNNLLSVYGDIELKYYKLWLSSTNILEKVLHSKIYNQSAFELEEIKEQVKLYVQNESFNKSLNILKNNRYVIVSGIPGIGKTTLSRILILYLLSNGFDEFVYLNQSIDDGYEFFADGKKQVFFFDDFLGKNFFEKKHGVNEDSKIVKFIQKIKRSPDKVLILATREYILNQAKNVFESFKIVDIEIAKCVLDLSSYTNLIKAQIIYNHLYFANVPVGHLEDLVVECLSPLKGWTKIVN